MSLSCSHITAPCSSYLREIFGRFVSRLCYSRNISFSLQCFQLLAHLNHRMRLLCCYLFLCLLVCLPVDVSIFLPSWCFHFLLGLFLSSYRTIHLIVLRPCLLVRRRYPSCCHTKHLLSSSHYHRAVLLPPFLNILQQSSFTQRLLPELCL